MVKIPIQLPPSNKNIPRYGNQSSERIQIESDRSVQVLLKSRALLRPELNEFLYQLLGSAKKIDESLSQLRDTKFPTLTFEDIRDVLLSKLKSSEYDPIKKTDPAAADKLLFRLVDETTRELSLSIKQSIFQATKALSDKTELSIDEFERNYASKLSGVNLDILQLHKFYFCKNCMLVVSESRFKQVKCHCSATLSKSEDVHEMTITKISENLFTFISKNMWLEYGIEQLFEDMGYNTKCGCNILGTSGVLHEVDVLAERSANDKVICECKTTPPTLSDVGIFYSKLVDVAAFRGYLFTTALNTEEDVRRFARSKNIVIIEAVLGTENEALIEKIQKGIV